MVETKSYVINEKNICIKAALIELYEKYVGKFTEKTVKYFYRTCRLPENTPIEKIEKEINAGIAMEIDIYTNKEKIINELKEKGELMDYD